MHSDAKTEKALYEYIVVGHNSSLFVTDTSTAKNKYTENDIVMMLDFLIVNNFVECGGVIFQQVIGIPMGTNCALLLSDLFLYSHQNRQTTSSQIITDKLRYILGDKSLEY